MTEEEPLTASILRRIDTLERGHFEINDKLTKNTIITESVKVDTAEIVQLFRASKTFINILSYMIPISKFIIALGALVIFLWSIYRGKPSIPVL